MPGSLNPEAKSFFFPSSTSFHIDRQFVTDSDDLQDARAQSPIPDNHQAFNHFQLKRATTLDDLIGDCFEADDRVDAQKEDADQSVTLEDEHSELADTEHQSEQQIQLQALEKLYSFGFVPLLGLGSRKSQQVSGAVQALQALDIPLSRLLRLQACVLHDREFINDHPERLYTSWLNWHLEISNHLFRNICPSDLNNMPCEWDELCTLDESGPTLGCPMLRLCPARRLYPVVNPNADGGVELSFLPECNGDDRHRCIYIHDIAPNCRSIGKPYTFSYQNYPHLIQAIQSCPIVAAQASLSPDQWTEDTFCTWGHDFEGARLESLWRYWEHRAQARRRGSIGLVTRDRFGRTPWKPKRPDVRSLLHAQETTSRHDTKATMPWAHEQFQNQDIQPITEDDAREPEIDHVNFVGRTFHGHYVKLSFELGEKWIDGNYHTFEDLRVLRTMYEDGCMQNEHYDGTNIANGAECDETSSCELEVEAGVYTHTVV